MPNWKTHLEVGKRINLNFSDKEFEEFMLGSLLPDVNNGHLVKDVSKVLDVSITHFLDSDKPNYKEFYSHYGKLIKDEPLLLGYYVHLYTDYIFNENFYNKYEKIQTEYIDDYSLMKLKHIDFAILNKEFDANNITINDIDNLLAKTKLIKEISITKDDIYKVQIFLSKKTDCDKPLNFYTLDELKDLTDYCVNKVNRLITNLN